VHRPWTAVMGDAEEMRRQADTLEKAWAAMRVTYARRTGRRAETIEKLVAAAGGEWWMTAEEAVKHGFADLVEKPSKQAAVYGLRHFRKVPERLAARAIDDDAVALPQHPEVAEIEPPRVEAQVIETDDADDDEPSEVADAPPNDVEEPSAPDPEDDVAARAMARRRRIAEALSLTC